jgi:hypothetical protein
MYQKELAALLYAGPGSLITGPMALMHHSIRSGSAVEVIDVLVPAAVAQMIKGALERGLTRPALPIRTIPCKTSVPGKGLGSAFG